jgi:methionine synthase II (cobalamin-independent)
MTIPTEPIGSIPRPVELIDALAKKDSDDPSLVPLYEAAVRDTLERFEATGSPITEGRLAIKVDPSGQLLNSFIDLNNLALARFSPDDRRRIGVHTCPGGDRDSTHSADVDYLELLPSLFQLKAGRFYVALAHEPDRARVLRSIQQHMKPDRMIFVGVTAPIDPRIETRRRSATSSSRRRATSRWDSSARPTTVASHRSATTRRRPATRRSRRSARACGAPRSPARP